MEGPAGQTGHRGHDDSEFTEPVLRFWRNYLIASATLNQKISHDLHQALSLTLGDFGVLVHLARHPEHRLRMATLADTVCFTRSRTTQIVARLERSGYVVRDADDSDGRGVYACLTQSGHEVVREATKVQRDAAANHFIQFLDDDEMDRLSTVFGEVIRSLSDFDCSGTPSEVFSRE
jgi:DNA-binding MarR family transcriptional regulator